MPNWCYSNVEVEGIDSVNLYCLLNKWTSKNYVENGFGLRWLGNIVGNSGIEKLNHPDDNFNFPCRGTIGDINYINDRCYFYLETAWNPMFEMWFKIFDDYNLNCNLLYTAEEPGNDIYCTNMSDYEGNYYLDVFDDIEGFDDLISDECLSDDGVLNICSDLLDSRDIDYSDMTLEEIIDEVEDTFDGIRFHQWEYVPAEDF